MMNEVKLARYFDCAIRDFNGAVGMVPAAIAIKDSHGYYGFLWKIGQDSRFSILWREEQRIYDWIKVFPVRNVDFNEFFLLLYVNPHRVHGLKYVFENERVHRATPLLDGYRLPNFRVNENLEEFKCKSW